MIRFLLALFAIPVLAFSQSLSDGEAELIRLVDREAGDGVEVVPLWPGDGTPPNVPRKLKEPESVVEPRSGNPSVRNVTKPSLVIVEPRGNATKRAGVTMVFAPGGGYGALGLNIGRDLQLWADAIGADFALLKYRVPRAANDPGRRMQLSDAQRALRILRGRSDNRIIFFGASAGGHLAFNLANNHAEEIVAPLDDTDRLSARPDAVVLLYPAYLTQPIVSMDADPHLHLDQVSPERTPPLLLAVTRPDKFTHGAVNAMLALRRAKVPAELHIYPEGGHAGGFDKYPLMEFVRPTARFLRDQGIFTEDMAKVSNQFLDRLEATFLKRPESGETAGEGKPVAGALPAAEWTAGDRALAGLRKPATPILRLWPGDGTREDDPARDLEETVPDSSDGRVRIGDVSRPTLHVWRPEKPDGRAVLIFPGGAYNKLAAQHEGTEIAQWLNDQGITAFLCKYRVPRREGRDKHTVALQDAQQAITMIRARAEEFGIESDQLGVIGFSAGGNLAALTVHQAPNRRLKPDFALLIYPAYLNLEREGAELDPVLRTLRGRADYAPTFIAVAKDDPFAAGSLHYFRHLQLQRIATELHVYNAGGHGKGLDLRGYPFSAWTRAAERWLADLKHGTTHILLNRER